MRGRRAVRECQPDVPAVHRVIRTTLPAGEREQRRHDVDHV